MGVRLWTDLGAADANGERRASILGREWFEACPEQVGEVAGRVGRGGFEFDGARW